MSAAPFHDPYPNEPPPSAESEVEIKWRLPARIPWVTYLIVALCIVLFLLQMLSEKVFGYDIPFIYLGKINPFIQDGELWRLLTPALLHGSVEHILFNLYALWVVGRDLERQYGHARFTLLFLTGAYAGNALSFLCTPNPALGASTAIFGLVAAQAIFVYHNRPLFRNAWAALFQAVLIIVINLGLGLSGTNIDNWGHLGGLIGGLAFAWFAGPRWRPAGTYPDLYLVDQRSLRQAWPVLAGVVAVFGVLVVIGMLS